MAADRRDVRITVDRAGTPHLAGKELFQGELDGLLDHFESLVPATRPYALITPNVDQAINLRDDAGLRTAFEHADILIADGTPLVALARSLGAHRLHRLTGADLLPAAAERAARTGWRIVLTGGRSDITVKAAANLRETYGADVVAVPFPLISGPDDPAGRDVVEALRSARADLVFVCLGSPKQDVWVDLWRDELPPAIYIGAGAAVDFAAGVKSRAPRLVQRLGAEWLYRLAQEPRRLARRYMLRGPLFLLIVLKSVATSRKDRR
jgi:N-acetylglucosaminyldiphosphoundecaprenol N-acetyl-beta-D-mannosaminyltransferase